MMKAGHLLTKKCWRISTFCWWLDIVKAIAADVLRRYELSPVESEPPLDMGLITVMVPGGVPMKVHTLG
jgi:hypothetical protein